MEILIAVIYDTNKKYLFMCLESKNSAVISPKMKISFNLKAFEIV
jgi:hypothetical protein